MNAPPAPYTAVAIALHWLMALLLVGMLAVGFYMVDLPVSPWKLKIYSWHKWTGVTLFVLVSVRLVWRLSHRPPDLPRTMSALARLVTHSGHWLLYGLMFAIPVSGWLMSSAKGFQTVYLGVLPIPDLVGKNKVLGDLLLRVHQTLNLLFVATLLCHVGMVLKGHWVDKRPILRRMLPRRGWGRSAR